MQTPNGPNRDLINACRRHIERVRRHGRHTVALIEQIRLRARRKASLPAAHLPIERQQHGH